MSMQEMKDESEVPFTKGPGEMSGTKRKGRLYIILGAVVVIIVLVIIIICVAASKGGDDSNSSEPEEKFDPKDTNIFLVGRYEVTSATNPTKIMSTYSSYPRPKEYLPLLSSVYIDDKKVEDLSQLNSGTYTFDKEGIHKVEFYFKKDVEFLDSFFQYTPLTEVFLSNIDTSKVTTMAALFKGCPKLNKVHYGDKFNTQSLTNMAELFSGCANLTEIDLSKFDTKNVENMDSLFEGCENLNNINYGNFNTANATRMRKMLASARRREQPSTSQI